MPPIARGQTWLFQPLPLSTVPNNGRVISNSRVGGGGKEGCSEHATECFGNRNPVGNIT